MHASILTSSVLDRLILAPMDAPASERPEKSTCGDPYDDGAGGATTGPGPICMGTVTLFVTETRGAAWGA